jgi:hypothetical protein
MASQENTVIVNDNSPDLRSSSQTLWTTLETNVRNSPGEYVILSFLLGFFLQIVPVRALVHLLVRIATVAIRPAAIVLAVWGVVKSVRGTRAAR